MLPSCRPLDGKYFQGTQYGFIGSVYGNGNPGLQFNPPFRIHLRNVIKKGDRSTILNNMEEKYTSTHLYLDKITQSKYIQNEIILERQNRLYDPMYKRLYLSHNEIDYHANDICKSTVYDIQVANQIMYARLMSCVVYFPIDKPQEIQFTNQTNLLLDILPDEAYNHLYMGIENYYLKTFDMETMTKINSFAFKSSDVSVPYKWCCIQPGVWQTEKYFVNAEHIYLADIREKKAKSLVKLHHLKYFGFKKCTDLHYVSVDSEGVNLYDARMISTPITRRNHEIINMAPRLYDVSIINNNLRVLVGSHSYPSLNVVEFEKQDNWLVNYNIFANDISPFDGDHFAYWDKLDASHLKLLSVVFKNEHELMLTFNDNTVCRALINRKTEKQFKMPLSDKLDTMDIKEEETNIILKDSNVEQPSEAEYDTDFKNIIPLDFFASNRFIKKSAILDNDSTEIEDLPWDTVAFTTEDNLIIKYPDEPSDMILKYAQRFKQMMKSDANDYDPIMTFQDTLNFPPTLMSGINSSQLPTSQEPKKKKKKRGFF